MTIRLPKLQNRYITIINTCILFFTVFSINLKGLIIKPRFLTMGAVFIVAIVNLFINKRTTITFKKKDIVWLLFLTFLLIYSVLIVSINGVWSQYNCFNDTFNAIIFFGLYPILLACFFKDEYEFCQSLTYATTVHAIIVIFSFVSPNFRLVLESIQNISFDRYNYRVVGLGIAGSGGSVYLVTGLISCTYLLLFYKHNSFKNMFKFLIIFISIFLVGRTGLYVAIVFLLYLVFFYSKNIFNNLKNIMKIIVTVVLIFIFSFGIMNIMNIEIDNKFFIYTYNRAFELFKGVESYTFTALREMDQNIPPLTLETFFGTGIVRGQTSTGLNIQHDGGYVKRYVSIGLLMAIFSYIGYIAYNLINISKMRKQNRMFMYLTLILLLIIEYKEPFIYMLAYPFTIIMISNLNNKRIEKYGNKYKVNVPRSNRFADKNGYI